MTDREKYLTILDRFYRGRGGSLLTKDECEAMDYAISSIKTDLKYDLLYEETNHIANVSKMTEPTPKNDLGVEFISKSDVDRIIDCPYFRQADKLIQIMNLPPVTPQEPIDYKTQYENYLKKSEVVISQLRADRDRLQDAFDKLRAEIKHYQSDYDVHGTEYDRTAWKAFNRCLQIIDKHKAEVKE